MSAFSVVYELAADCGRRPSWPDSLPPPVTFCEDHIFDSGCETCERWIAEFEGREAVRPYGVGEDEFTEARWLP